MDIRAIKAMKTWGVGCCGVGARVWCWKGVVVWGVAEGGGGHGGRGGGGGWA